MTLTASVGDGASGRVTFYDDVTDLGVGVLVNGQAILKAPFLLPGAHPLRARYDGDGTHAAASSAVVAQAILPSTSLGFGELTLPNPPDFETQADFNGDGITDVAVIVPPIAGGQNGISPLTAIVFLGNGDGTFRMVSSYTLPGETAGGLVTGDFNGDGIPDLAASGHVVTILLGNGDGTFQRRLANGDRRVRGHFRRFQRRRSG